MATRGPHTARGVAGPGPAEAVGGADSVFDRVERRAGKLAILGGPRQRAAPPPPPDLHRKAGPWTPQRPCDRRFCLGALVTVMSQHLSARTFSRDGGCWVPREAFVADLNIIETKDSESIQMG